jgi:hypothetical protein
LFRVSDAGRSQRPKTPSVPERAKAINARDDLLCGISELRLYGSMLDPKVETVGDVDVAYELFYKQPPPGKRRSEWHIERAEQSGRKPLFPLGGGGQGLSVAPASPADRR